VMIDLIWRPRLITGRGSVGAGFDGDDATSPTEHSNG
jgi:hypothetical protein